MSAYPGSIEYVDGRLAEIQSRFAQTIERARAIIGDLLESGVRTPSVVTGEYGVTFCWHVNGWDAELSVGSFDEDNNGPMLWCKRRHETAQSYEDVPLSDPYAAKVLAELRHDG